MSSAFLSFLFLFSLPDVLSRSCLLFVCFQSALWRKWKAPRRSRPTTRHLTAACTPTPKAAPCRRSTAAPTPALSRRRRSRPPGRSCEWRLARESISWRLPKDGWDELPSSFSLALETSVPWNVPPPPLVLPAEKRERAGRRTTARFSASRELQVSPASPRPRLS